MSNNYQPASMAKTTSSPEIIDLLSDSDSDSDSETENDEHSLHSSNTHREHKSAPNEARKPTTPIKRKGGSNNVKAKQTSSKPRGCDGYRLNKGEEFVWATDHIGNHQAIVLYPQPPAPPNMFTEFNDNNEDMVYIKWFLRGEMQWILRSNIIETICADGGGAISDKEGKDSGGEPLDAKPCCSTGPKRTSKRKREPTNHYSPKPRLLALERAFQERLEKRKTNQKIEGRKESEEGSKQIESRRNEKTDELQKKKSDQSPSSKQGESQQGENDTNQEQTQQSQSPALQYPKHKNNGEERKSSQRKRTPTNRFWPENPPLLAKERADQQRLDEKRNKEENKEKRQQQHRKLDASECSNTQIEELAEKKQPSTPTIKKTKKCNAKLSSLPSITKPHDEMENTTPPHASTIAANCHKSVNNNKHAMNEQRKSTAAASAGQDSAVENNANVSGVSFSTLFFDEKSPFKSSVSDKSLDSTKMVDAKGASMGNISLVSSAQQNHVVIEIDSNDADDVTSINFAKDACAKNDVEVPKGACQSGDVFPNQSLSQRYHNSPQHIHTNREICVEDESVKSDLTFLEADDVDSMDCPVCERHVYTLERIDTLLKCEVQDNFNEFAKEVKDMLNGIEEDFNQGFSIFYHNCSEREEINPLVTIIKLIKITEAIYRIAKSGKTNESETSIMALIFGSRKKTSRYGIIPQLLYISSLELINSRVEYLSSDDCDLDQVIGVTFGFHLLQSMSRNIYAESKRYLHDRPLEFNTMCVKRNCHHKNHKPIPCVRCGLRFHPNCFKVSTTPNFVGELQKHCPSCGASEMLMNDARLNNLSNIYSLIFTLGASPVQPLQFSGSNCGSETALHVAVQSNNYDLTSMLLYGAHLLLNCDDSVLDWNFPEIVWGVDARGRTPFKSGFDMIVNNLDRQPPIETLLLLCSRGVPRQPSDIQEARTRRHQMKLIRDKIGGCSDLLLKEDISMGGELKPVALNIDDNEGNSHLDLNSFLYVTKAIESRNTAIRWFDCRCGKGKQLTSFDGECTEDKRKILHRKQKMKVSWKTYCNYLTNSMGKKCVCKNANSGLQRRLEVFLTLDGRGFGVQTRKGSVIKKDEIICHYAGEIITSDEARKREVQYAKTETGSYIIEVDEQGDYCIDGTYLRSVTAFINHSCSDGNIEAFRALGNHLDANFPFIAFRAKKDIAELTELTFNYVKGVGNHEKEKPKSMCSVCNTVHCLCKQCKEIRHGMHKITTL